MSSLRADFTRKQEFDAIAGPERLWWRYCQDFIRDLSGEGAGARLGELFQTEGHLTELGDTQASSDDIARTFIAAVHMVADITRGIAGHAGDDVDEESPGTLARVARFWAHSGLLAPKPDGERVLLRDESLSPLAPALREPLRALAGTLGGDHTSAAQAMVLLTALRLAGLQPRSRRATHVPVLFDKTGTGVSGVLQIRDLPGGPAGLYPDPEAMSFIKADAEFTAALAQAWFYATGRRLVDHCVVWRLTLNEGVSLPYLRGGSLGAAFAIGLREHFRKQLSLTRPWEPAGTIFFGLRPRCAITGAIGIGETLASVGGMEAKLEAARASKWRLVAPAGNRDAAVHAPDGLHVYWAASLRQASGYARRWHPVRIGIAALVIVLLAAVSTVTARDNQLNRAEDSAAAVQLANANQSDPVLSRLDAVAAWRLAPSERTSLAMLSAATLPQIAALSAVPGTPGPVAFSPNGTLLAVAFGRDGGGPSGVQLWNVRTRQPAGLLQDGSSTAPGNGFSPIAFSPNGEFLAQGTNDGTVFLWDVATGRLAGHDATGLPGNGTAVSAVAFSPNGTTLAVAGIDGTTQLWNVSAGIRSGAAFRLTDDSIPPSAIAFSQDGAVLAAVVPVTAAGAAAESEELVRWGVDNHREIGTGLSVTGTVGAAQGAVAFSPDGETVAVGGYRPQVWSVTSRSQVVALPVPSGNPPQVDLVALSSDGSTLATYNGDGTTDIWDVAARQLITVLPRGGRPVSALALSPDGTTLATVTNDGTGHLWGIATASVFTTTKAVRSLAVAPARHVLAATVPGHPGAVQLWNTVTGHPVGALPSADTSGAGSAAFSPNGLVLAVGYNDGTVRLWRVASRQPMGGPLGYRDPFSSDDSPDPPQFAFSPDGEALLTDYFADTPQLWDVHTLARVGGLTAAVSVTVIAFGPNPMTLVTADETGVQLWNAGTRQPEGDALSAPDTPSSLAVSPDGKLIAAGYEDGVVRFWNVRTRQQAGATVTVAADSDQVDVMAFSPDGQTLAVGSYDGAVRLVAVKAAQPIGEPLITPGFTGAVQVLSFSPDGGTLVAGTGGETRLLHVGYLVDPVAYLCAMAGRTFTRTEWARYVPEVGYQNVCR